jgi:site-specific DNA recombinase
MQAYGSADVGEGVPLLEALLAGDRPVAPDTPTKVKAFAWARVSTDLQEARGLSLPEQLRQIRAYAAENGYQIVAEYWEAASAFQSESKRVEFHRMLDAARSDARIGAILVHDYSRFSRNSVRATSLVGALRQQGIRVVSLNDPDFDPSSAAGVYVEAILFAKNEAYSREVAFHTTKACRANIRTRDEETGWCYKNGGRPLWGYRSEYVQRGGTQRGRPIIKRIWLPDETVVAGKPKHEWVRYCLVELAANGASLAELRDFCHGTGIPPPRVQYWGISTWHALLEPYRLLQYCGYGVWHVRARPNRVRSPSDWDIVRDAHAALITEEEARAIAATRTRLRHLVWGTPDERNWLPYLLSGGLFRCGRCGANMAGAKATEHRYYRCGSSMYRRGLGCGRSPRVREQWLDRRVIAGVQEFIARCFSDDGIVDWRRGVSDPPERGGLESWDRTAQELREAEREIGDLRRSIEEGLVGTAQVNERLRKLLELKAELVALMRDRQTAPQFGPEEAREYLEQVQGVLAADRREALSEQKALLRLWVDSVVLSPEERTVTVRYRMPDSIKGKLVPWRGPDPAAPGAPDPPSATWAIPARVTSRADAA